MLEILLDSAKSPVREMQWIQGPLQDPLNSQAQHRSVGAQSWNLNVSTKKKKNKKIEMLYIRENKSLKRSEKMKMVMGAGRWLVFFLAVMHS